MTHASLFSGIGGPEIAAAMLGWKNAFHCEINPFGCAVLKYWFPNSICYNDITKTDFREWRGRIDVLTGGFPCQPFSYAGKRGGRNDERYLWPEMLRVINEIRPTWVVGENVGGIATMVENGVCTELGCDTDFFGTDNDIYRYELRESYTIERISKDLEAIQYEIQSFLIPAAAVGAPHRRDRIFIVAYNADGGNDKGKPGEDAGTCGTKRIQERDEIRIVGKSNNVRSEIPGNTTDAVSGREKPREARGRTESDRGDGISIAEERGDASKRVDGFSSISRNVTDANGAGRKEPVKPGRGKDSKEIRTGLDNRVKRPCGDWIFAEPGMLPGKRWERFPTVPPVHGRNDGFPFNVDNLTIPFAKWRTESLKAYGNAIVPQVMYEIFRAIEFVNSEF